LCDIVLLSPYPQKSVRDRHHFFERRRWRRDAKILPAGSRTA
jgi:hypothetical protein